MARLLLPDTIKRGIDDASQTRASQLIREWQSGALLSDDDKTQLTAIADDMTPLIAFIAQHSPYLFRLTEMHPDIAITVCSGAAKETATAIIATLYEQQTYMLARNEANRLLRVSKQRIALLTGLCDIAHHFTLSDVTRTLSEFADASVQFTLEQLLRNNVPKDVADTPETLSDQYGIAIIGMGKLGAYELNYSSDIDLIIIYEPDKLTFLADAARNRFVVRLTQQLVAMLQNRDDDGYVFRVDLRLRPDPASTGLAVALHTALHYYERVGQNWERAAMIKARQIAGDTQTGQAFIKGIQPFIWRNHLDFAAIDDILSIKRQMQSEEEDVIELPDHNIKTGYGGIREIEFLASLHQLIWGGRIRDLRLIGTCAVIQRLPDYDYIEESLAKRLVSAYQFLRMVEHRLQMRRDQQTHSLPANQNELAILSAFCGAESPEVFSQQLLETLNDVHHIFSQSFRDSAPLGATGKLVFTGVEHDADTLTTLERMGFQHPSEVSTALQLWHKGTKRCTRTKRARELLTELVPVLLKELSQTLYPDTAFARFDRFLDALPAGVQPFSLFSANPELLTLITNVIGNAPVLASQLASYPQLLDVILDYQGGRYETDVNEWARELHEWLGVARNEEERIRFFSIFKMEHEFLVGLRLLQQHITRQQAGKELSALADIMIAEAVSIVTEQLQERYNTQPELHYAVIGLGKLGTQELMLRSDLDVMFLYQIDETSDGQQQYYSRLTARVLRLLAHPLKTGSLYDMDTKLRPYGAQGAVAVKLDAFSHYYEKDAWLVEQLALLQARVVYASPAIGTAADAALQSAQSVTASPAAVAEQVQDVRSKIHAQQRPCGVWDVKYCDGGLMDLEWIIKLLLARTVRTEHHINITRTIQHIKWLHHRNQLNTDEYALSCRAHQLYHCVLSFLRLCHEGALDDESITEETKLLLTNVTGHTDYTALRNTLQHTQRDVYAMYQNLSSM